MEHSLASTSSPIGMALEEHPPSSYWTSVGQRFMQHPLGRLGFCLLLILTFFTLFGPFCSPYAYDETHLAAKNLPPSGTFWFGTDELGRDLFTRTWYGARISLFVGISAALIDLSIGLIWGGIAGLMGKRTDEIMMRLADIFYSLPNLLMAILLVVLLGSGLTSMLVAITLTGWITMARMVRGQVLLLKEMEYVLAARALGAKWPRILFKHMIPQACGPISVTLTLTIPSAIFSEAFLSFLGLGIQAPSASWGTMAYEGIVALQYYPWRLFFPAGFLTATLLSFHLIGEGLKEAFEIRQDRVLA